MANPQMGGSCTSENRSALPQREERGALTWDGACAGGRAGLCPEDGGRRTASPASAGPLFAQPRAPSAVVGAGAPPRGSLCVPSGSSESGRLSQAGSGWGGCHQPVNPVIGPPDRPQPTHPGAEWWSRDRELSPADGGAEHMADCRGDGRRLPLWKLPES